MLRFVVLFLGLVAAFLVLGATNVAREHLHAPLSEAVAALVQTLLLPVGDASRSGTILVFEGFQAVVVEACNGFLPTAIYVAAVLAFPAAWRARAWGLGLGVPVIQAINLVRVASLMLLGAHWPSLFARVHIYVWQTLVIVCTMAVWMMWVETFVEPDDGAPARG